MRNKEIKRMVEIEEIPVYVHLPLQLLLTPAPHMTSWKVCKSRSAEGSAVLLSLFRKPVGMHQSKNTDLNHRIPQILSPLAL